VCDTQSDLEYLRSSAVQLDTLCTKSSSAHGELQIKVCQGCRLHLCVRMCPFHSVHCTLVINQYCGKQASHKQLHKTQVASSIVAQEATLCSTDRMSTTSPFCASCFQNMHTSVLLVVYWNHPASRSVVCTHSFGPAVTQWHIPCIPCRTIMLLQQPIGHASRRCPLCILLTLFLPAVHSCKASVKNTTGSLTNLPLKNNQHTLDWLVLSDRCCVWRAPSEASLLPPMLQATLI
jgi:hypothetical protein